GVDELPLPRPDQRLDEDCEDVRCEREADEEGDDEGRQAAEQPAPQLNEMIKQGLLGVVDVLHGSGRFSGGSSSSGCASSSGSIGSGTSVTGGISSGWPGSG